MAGLAYTRRGWTIRSSSTCSARSAISSRPAWSSRRPSTSCSRLPVTWLPATPPPSFCSTRTSAASPPSPPSPSRSRSARSPGSSWVRASWDGRRRAQDRLGRRRHPGQPVQEPGCAYAPRSVLVMPLESPRRLVGALTLARKRGPAIHLHRAGPDADHRQPGGDQHRQRPPATPPRSASSRRSPTAEARARGSQRADRRDLPAQERVPGQHEPRAAHSAQRHPGIQRDPQGQPGRSSPTDQRHECLENIHASGQASPRAGQRRPRPLQDRGRQDGAGLRPICGGQLRFARSTT